MTTTPPPSLIANRYELVRQLGEGGMGTVYEGRHRVTGRQVAVKLLHPQFATDPEIVERFLNEARAAALLGHPNIVECLDAGQTDDGQTYVVLQFLEGRSLAEELQLYGTLQPGRAVRIALQVVSALSAAHARGVIHRDLKPENIFLSQRPGEPDHVTVLDFGISRIHIGQSKLRTRAGTMMGTPAYMAPEQMADASKAEAPADIYALGVTLYQLLSGGLPFQADSLISLAVKIAQEPPPPLERRRPGLPAGLSEAVMRALAKAPGDRYPSMDAFGAALAPFADYVSVPWSSPRLEAAHIDNTARPQPSPMPAPSPLSPSPSGRPRQASTGAKRITAPEPAPAPAPLATAPARSAVGKGIALGLGATALLGLGAVAVTHLTREPEPSGPVALVPPTGAQPAKPRPEVQPKPQPVAPDPDPVSLAAETLTVPSLRPRSLPLLQTISPGLASSTSKDFSAKELAALRDLGTANLSGGSPAGMNQVLKKYSRLADQLGATKQAFTPQRHLAIGWLWLRHAQMFAGTVNQPFVDFKDQGCNVESVEKSESDLHAAIDAAQGEAILYAQMGSYKATSEYLLGVGQECDGRWDKASGHYEQAGGGNLPLRQNIALRRGRAALAQHDFPTARATLLQVPQGGGGRAGDGTPLYYHLMVWASVGAGDCDLAVQTMRQLHGDMVGASTGADPTLEALELSCLVDPAWEQSKTDPGQLDRIWSAPSRVAQLAAARAAYADQSSPAAALRSGLRLCYLRAQLARPPEALHLTVGGRLEAPELTGASSDRLDPLQQCLARQLAAARLHGPIKPSPVDLVAEGPEAPPRR